MAARRPWRWSPLDLLLLPAALLVVLAEDVLWRALRRLLEAAQALPPVAALHNALGRLPGWAALPLFLVPEAAGKLGELWALALVVGGHLVGAATVLLTVRLLAALIAVFIYRACEPALLALPWFAWAVARVDAVRDWALGMLRPARDWAGRRLAARRSRWRRRLARLRRHFGSAAKLAEEAQPVIEERRQKD